MEGEAIGSEAVAYVCIHVKIHPLSFGELTSKIL